MTKLDYSTREYWIVFTTGDHWLSKFLKKGFGHVYVVSRDKYNWVLLNPRQHRLEWIIPDCAVNVDYPALLRNGGEKVIKIRVRATKTSFYQIGCLNCVQMVQYMIGLPLGVRTPYGLYKKLKKLRSKNFKKNSLLRYSQIFDIHCYL